MSTEKVLKYVESVIRIKSIEIKKRKSCTSDEVRQLTGLVNAFTRLRFQADESESSVEQEGDSSYYDHVVVGGNNE